VDLKKLKEGKMTEDEKVKISRPMIMSRDEWFTKSIERGTSGDMVIDILIDWDIERRYLLSLLKEKDARIKELEHQNEVIINDSKALMFNRDQCLTRIKELGEGIESVRGERDQDSKEIELLKLYKLIEK